MPQPDPPAIPSPSPEPSQNSTHPTSKNITNHLANERTFLAWIRTGLATITFGFVVARFGLLLRELDLKHISAASTATIHYSSIIGVSLTILGVLVMALALVNFLHIRREIDRDQFHPQSRFAILLTVLACLIGLVLAFYLSFTA